MNSTKKKENRLHEAIKEAERSEGFLVMITRRQNGMLYHNQFVVKMGKEDLGSAHTEHYKLLKPKLHADEKDTDSK